MSKIHFFTDIDLLLPQNSSEGFGAVESIDLDFETGKDKYRLYTAHRSSENGLAYAVCDAQILVQQDNVNQNLVNIVLKPEAQTEINLPSIKYFVYRGILKSSLIDGEYVANGNNTLAKSICSNNAITPKKVLGIELTGNGYLDSDLIENAFYFEKPDFELWKVQGGWSIGTFDKDGATEIFGPVSSNCELENSSMTVYPNPTADNFTVLIQTTAAFENATLELIDNTGRLVSSKTLDIEAGSTTIPFDSEKLQAGVYVIRMRGEGDKFKPVQVVRM